MLKCEEHVKKNIVFGFVGVFFIYIFSQNLTRLAFKMFNPKEGISGKSLDHLQIITV